MLTQDNPNRKIFIISTENVFNSSIYVIKWSTFTYLFYNIIILKYHPEMAFGVRSVDKDFYRVFYHIFATWWEGDNYDV